MSKFSDLVARDRFETWAKEGSRPAIYTIQELAGGEYLSTFTELAWQAYKAGWDARAVIVDPRDEVRQARERLDEVLKAHERLKAESGVE